MRATWILALALFVASGSSHVEAQRQRSRLQQMFTDFVDDVGDVASRIGHGFLRLGRERPAVPRQQLPFNGPARQQEENAIAPNDPGARPLPAVRQTRPRLTFRQFVDGVFSGISNWMPSLRRRAFNRNNRAGQHQ